MSPAPRTSVPDSVSCEASHKHSDLAANSTPFPIQKLPTEIQVHIWKYAAAGLEPRLIELSYQRRKRKFQSPTLAPSLLHICSSSRFATLQSYTPLNFGNDFSGTHVNWEKDTLFFHEGSTHPDGGYFGNFDRVNLSAFCNNCKNVAMDYRMLENYLRYNRVFHKKDAPFVDIQRLAQVTVVVAFPTGEGNLSLELEDPWVLPAWFRPEEDAHVYERRMRGYVAHGVPHIRSMDYQCREVIQDLDGDLVRQARGNIKTFIAYAIRGKEMRLKGHAKILRWKGGA